MSGDDEPGARAAARDVADLADDAARTRDDAARQELLELSTGAAGIGTFDWDLLSGALVWDDRLIDLFGLTRDGFDQSIEAFNARVHPEDLPGVAQRLGDAIDAGGEFTAEYRIVRPAGDIAWIGARGRVLCDEAGSPVRLLGAAWDVTAHREGEARIQRVLESMSTAFFSLDTAWRFTYVNRQAEVLLGRTREEMLGGVVWDLFPAAVGSDFERHYAHAMSTGETVTFDAYYPAPLDAWYEVRAWRNPEGLAVYFLDVTSRRRLQEQSEEVAARARLLGLVTEGLVATLDLDEATARLAHLVVPAVGDWCVVTLVDDDSRPGSRRGLRYSAAHHVDPAMQAVTEAYGTQRLAALRDDELFVRAMETATPQVLNGGAGTAARSLFDAGPVRETLQALAPDSVVIYPLTGRHGPVGLLTVCNGSQRGAFTDDDLATIEQIAARAGLVLDNARLYRQQRDLAEGLQRSLLTPPPEPDHCQVVVRYTPAAQAAQVGGDWYDAFLQPQGAMVLVIGDVVGHDTQAAAAMSQVRTLLRGIAALDDDGPADILHKVDRVMETLQTATTATAVVARLEQTPQERFQGVTRLRWSNAGHPPPMVVHPDGTVLPLTDTADLLLGVLPGIPRGESEVTLPRDAVVLLYTDGLVERRGQSLEVGLELLQETLRDLAGNDLDELCDQLLVRMLPPRPEDDIALVAVRLHPQDQPRPPEAGPERIPPGVPRPPDVRVGG